MRSFWSILHELSKSTDAIPVLELNMAVLDEIEDFQDLRCRALEKTLDDWTQAFSLRLTQLEVKFASTPEKWKNDSRFFRVGMLAGFIGHDLGIQYNDQRNSMVCYTDPEDLFLHGVIERRRGTCANMAALHVAIARNMGWPVSVACVGSHFISRFDDGEVVHNIEVTSAGKGSFASDSDDEYLARFKLPKLAKDCGSDLRCLTMKEMLGVFVSLRARYYADTGETIRADADYALSRALFPTYRRTFTACRELMSERESSLFADEETNTASRCFSGSGGDVGRYLM